jgi:hypothetical protein
MMWRRPRVGAAAEGVAAGSVAAGYVQGVPPRLAVAGIFGKHPAWPDHIALPLESAALRSLRGRLYDGIRSAIARGAWGQRAAGSTIAFGHWFCAAGMSDEGGWIVGRLWESRDAVGRSEYPMVACVHLFAGSCAAAIAAAGTVLSELEVACRTATTQSPVLAAVERAAGDAAVAAAALAATPLPHAPARAPVDSATAAAVSWEWAEQLWQLCKAARQRFRFRNTPARMRGVRLHARGGSAGAALCHWASTAAQRARGRGAVFAACPDGMLWVDVVVGDLMPAAVERLRVGVAASSKPAG